jgi:rhodanese-related sulfurtransferase
VIALAFRQFLILALLAVVPALVSGAIQLKWQKNEPLAPGEIRAEAVRLWKDQVVWVDARPRARYDTGHIDGAVLLNEDEWDALVPEFLNVWDPEKAVVVYCDGGGCDASHDVANRLRRDFAIETVYVLKGGYPAWRSN